MIQRGSEGPERLSERVERLERRRAAPAGRLGVGTLACPHCDAPVMPEGAVAPADTLACPFCAHAGAVRDFLLLAAPSRPARVEVRVRAR